MKSTIALLLGLLCLARVFAQAPPASFFNRTPPSTPGSEKLKKRSERFTRVRTDSAAGAASAARWEAFNQSKAKILGTESTAAVANWQSCGPDNQGGRMISHAFDPQVPGVLWAGSAAGGLWKTTDGGNTWQAMTDNLPTMPIGAVAINPQNNNEMLIGTGEGYLLSAWLQYGAGVFRSTDGGATWLPTGLTVPDSAGFASLAITWDPVNTNNVLLASTYGIYRSTDGGQNWVQTLSGYASALVMKKKDPAVAYAAMQDYQGKAGGIFLSLDSGVTWQPLAGGLPAAGSYGFTTLAICDSVPNVLYAGVSFPAASSGAAKW